MRKSAQFRDTGKPDPNSLLLAVDVSSRKLDLYSRHRSTIGREFGRNENRHGCYRPSKAQEKTNGRRKRSRRNSQFSADDWRLVNTYIGKQWSGAGIRMAGQRRDAEDFSRDDLPLYLDR